MARIQRPEEELAAALDMPGLTPNQVRALEAAAEAAIKNRKEFGLDFVKESRERAKERSRLIDDALFDCMQAAHDLEDRTRKGELDRVQDGFRAADDLRRQVDTYERQIEALETTHEVVSAVAGDPVSYWYTFHERWPTLAKNVPSITDVLGPLAGVNKT